jgi:hypothetical protein
LANFRDYHLVGGTALALQIGHRLSHDFDLFTDKPIVKDIAKKVKKIFRSEKILPSFQSHEQYDVFISGIKTTFRYYPYPPVYRCRAYHDVPLLSIKDIGAAKAFAIGKRAAYRDYVDMYFILKESYVTLGAIIALAEKKYSDEFNGRLFLEQLVYLGDIHDTKVEFLRDKVSEKKLALALKAEVKAYVKNFLQ